uniref:Uncharacterized protein n=1 Tax=Avena sativa TaxID=4498 RepID=A0ACD5Y4K7_AVESA
MMARACMPPAPVSSFSRPRVLVLGGTGRVGASTATALSELRPDLNIVIGGRNREKGASLVSELGGRSEFIQVDIHNATRLEAVMEGVDLVVHAAGPFQRDDKCIVLQAAISAKTGYIDVCDGVDYSWRAKSFHEQAKASGVPALTTAGISPGVSNVMAAELDVLQKDVIAYEKGREIKLNPYSGARNIDFGEGTGKKCVYLMNLPEVKSAHKILGVPTVGARFGTDPFFWIWGMETFANFLPADLLRDKNVILKLTECVDPFIRVIDSIVGERVAMRIDLECSNGHKTTGLFTHNNLSVSVGYGTAAFALAILEGSTKPGVWFPEEPEGLAIEARKLLLQRASRGVVNFSMNM